MKGKCSNFFESIKHIISVFTSKSKLLSVVKEFVTDVSESNNEESAGLSKKQRFFKSFLSLRLKFSKKYESSTLAKGLEYAFSSFACLPLRAVGLFMLTYASILIVSGILLIQNFSYKDLLTDNYIFLLIIFCISIILLPIKKTIKECAYSSFFASKFISNEKTTEQIRSTVQKNDVKGYTSSFLLGILCAIASMVFSPSYVFTIILAFITTSIIFVKPESGLLVYLLGIQILDKNITLYLICVSFISFILKYLRAKRHIDFKKQDKILLSSLVIVALYGFIGNNSFHTLELLSAVFAGILCVNLVRSEKMAYKSTEMLLASSYIFSAICFADILLPILPKVILPVSVSDFLISPVFNFSTSYTCQSYILCLILPFIFSNLINSGWKIQLFIIFAITLTSLILISDAKVVVTAIISMILVLIFKNKKYALLLLLVIPACIYSAAILDFIQPKSIEILNNYNNQSYAFVDLIQIIKDNFFFGTGVFYNTNAPLVLQIIAQFGIPVFIFFVIGFFTLLKKGLRFILTQETKDTKMSDLCTGLYCSSVTFALLSLICNTASDIRVIYLFVCIICLCVSCARSSYADYIDPYSVREHIVMDTQKL